MDRFNKSILVRIHLITIFYVILSVTDSAFGQSRPVNHLYHQHYHHSRRPPPQSVWRGQYQHSRLHHSPSRQYAHVSPVASSPTIVTSAPHYSSSPAPPMQSPQSFHYYPPSDHFYVHDRQRVPKNSAHKPFYISPNIDAYYSSPSYYYHASTSPTGGTPVVKQQSLSYSYPEEHSSSSAYVRLPPHYSPVTSYSTKYPSALSSRPYPTSASGNTDTYREAMVLFSEVVRKLGKEARSVSGLKNVARFLLSNGIYGSSMAPHHLDHLMGPEFIHRAQKLYNKIIKEQNERLSRQNQVSTYEGDVPLSFGRNHGGDYVENMVGSYNQPTYFSRNIIVGGASPTSLPLEEVTSLEALSDIHGQHHQIERGEDMMQVAESSMPSATFFPPDSSSSASPTAIPLIHQQSSTTPAITPLNENDFIEHPLAYEEYEGFVKDILQNHDYRK